MGYNFYYLIHIQPISNNTCFNYFIFQTRKWLLLLGFDFANPENHKFQKKLYLD